MLCKGCGKEISNDNVFCPNCGYKNVQGNTVANTKKCVDCGKEFPEERFFCDACGGKLTPIVPLGNPVPPQQVWNSSNMGSSNMVPPNGMNPNRMNPGGMSPNSMPPIPNYPYNNGKKKHKAALPIIIVSAVVVVICVVLWALASIGNAFNDLVVTNSITPTSAPVIGNDVMVDDTTSDPTIDNSTDNTTDNTSDNTTSDSQTPNYNMVYTYSELPDVMSLDSDPRFSYVDYYSSEGIYNYQFYFSDAYTSDDYVTALTDYSSMLQSLYGFYYEQDFSESQYSETGEVSLYLTKDDYCLAITSSKDKYNETYISIFSLSQDNTGGATQEVYFPNYTTYVVGREITNFSTAQEVSMNNNVSFYLNSIVATDLGDGTMALDVNVDLASYYTDSYLYDMDFMVLPMDTDGNILADMSSLSMITDVNGNQVYTPLLLSTEAYQNYNLTFYVPTTTTTFTFYGTNCYAEGFAGPLYSIDMTLN